MQIKRLIPLCLLPTLLTGCGKNKQPELTPEEKEYNALTGWFENSITDEEEFTDILNYQYYARTIGLEKDSLLDPQMWEVFYSDNVNINKEIDGQAIYLIRLNPYKLMEVWAENNETTADELLDAIGTTPDELYYNFGYTSNSIDYAKNHKVNKVSYTDDEIRIFGADNGEDRSVVFGTHFLSIDTKGKYKVTYSTANDVLAIKQKDMLNIISKESHNISEYTDAERNPSFFVDGVGIRRVLELDIPNTWSISVDKGIDTDVSVMFNMSPFSYGCTAMDIVELPKEEPEEAENTDVPVGHESDEE